MSPKKRNWIAPLVLIALFFYMAVRLFSMNSAQPKVEYRTIVDYFRNQQVTEYELDFGTGELTMKLRNQLLGIQLGEIEDPHNWMWKVC